MERRMIVERGKQSEKKRNEKKPKQSSMQLGSKLGIRMLASRVSRTGDCKRTRKLFCLSTLSFLAPHSCKCLSATHSASTLFT